VNPAPAAAESGATLGAPVLPPATPAVRAPIAPPPADGTRGTYPSDRNVVPPKAPGENVVPSPEKPVPPTTFQNQNSWQRPPAPAAPANGGPALSPLPSDGRTTALPAYRTGFFKLVSSPSQTKVASDTVRDR
jgi:hypothetical protein